MKSNFELIFELYIKLFVVINKINAKISSQTQFYSDFEPFTNPQLIKKTLQINCCRRVMLGHHWRVPDLRPTPAWLPGQLPVQGDPPPYPNSPSWTRYLNKFLLPSLFTPKELNCYTGFTFDEFYEWRDLYTVPYWQRGGAAGHTK